MADPTVTEEEAGRTPLEIEQESQAEASRQHARKVATERGDQLSKGQRDRLAVQPDELRLAHERARSRQRQIDDYNAEQRRIAEAARKRQADQEAEAKEAEIRDAKSRYAQALGNDYDIRDPYGSLARASMTEYASFRRDREELSRQIAAETDPAKRKALELRQEIEYCDYISITSHRIAGQSEVIVGRSNTDEAVRQRAQAKEHEARARELRAQYRQNIAEQQLGKDAEPELEPEHDQTHEPSSTAPTPRQRGQRTSRGRAERNPEQETEAGDADPGDAEPRCPQRGEPTEEGTSHPRGRGPDLER